MNLMNYISFVYASQRLFFFCIKMILQGSRLESQLRTTTDKWGSSTAVHLKKQKLQTETLIISLTSVPAFPGRPEGPIGPVPP